MSRHTKIIWDGQSTGTDGFSDFAAIGVNTDVTLYLDVNGATRITVLCAVDPHESNYAPDFQAFFPYYSIYSNDSLYSESPQPVDAIGGDVRRPLEIAFDGVARAAFDIAPFSPGFLMLQSTEDVVVTAIVETTTASARG